MHSMRWDSHMGVAQVSFLIITVPIYYSEKPKNKE